MKLRKDYADLTANTSSRLELMVAYNTSTIELVVVLVDSVVSLP